MKENNELEQSDICINKNDIEVGWDDGQEIIANIETRFDVDKKFGISIASEKGTWLEMYGRYNPYEDTLRIECQIVCEGGCDLFEYKPAEAEAQLIKEMITQKICEEYGQTPQEFCEDSGGAIELGGII